MSGSVTVSWRQGIRIALRLLWDSLWAAPHGIVTFYFGDGDIPEVQGEHGDRLSVWYEDAEYDGERWR